MNCRALCLWFEKKHKMDKSIHEYVGNDKKQRQISRRQHFWHYACLDLSFFFLSTYNENWTDILCCNPHESFHGESLYSIRCQDLLPTWQWRAMEKKNVPEFLPHWCHTKHNAALTDWLKLNTDDASFITQTNEAWWGAVSLKKKEYEDPQIGYQESDQSQGRHVCTIKFLIQKLLFFKSFREKGKMEGCTQLPWLEYSEGRCLHVWHMKINRENSLTKAHLTKNLFIKKCFLSCQTCRWWCNEILELDEEWLSKRENR